MKKILLILLIMCMFGCSKKDSILSYEDKIIFRDSRGYYLYLYYEKDDLINAEWRIKTSSLDDANKITNAYKNDTNYSISLSGTMVILKYSEEYMNEVFGDITKNDMKNYLIDNGYEVTEEE